MNSYLAEFLTLGLDKHLKNLYDIFFDFNSNLLSSFFYWVFLFVFVSIVFVFPCLISKIVSRIEDEHPKYSVFIDIVLIVIVSLVAMNVTFMYSGISMGLSSSGAFYGSTLRGVLEYRQNIGRFCAVIYSLLINSKLLNKYFIKLKIDKYKWSILSAVFVVWLFVLYYFYYLCQFR